MIYVVIKEVVMSDCQHSRHGDHQHQHGPNCGHIAVYHIDHIDYLHSGHLHHPHQDHIDEHKIEISEKNPACCTRGQNLKGHSTDHVHGADCGHEAIPHGDHIDYVVNGRLHHLHGDHCDDHGPVELAHL